jgi:glucose/arabinose dehydrogenase
MKLLPTVLVASALIATAAHAEDAYTVVASGLQSPRGLTTAPGGRLYVAQSGSGGSTGKITEIRNYWTATPATRDVVTGLVSIGGDGEFVSAEGVSADSNGNIFAIMSESNSGVPEIGPSLLGHLLKLNTAGAVRDVANVGDANYAWTADHVSLAPRDFPDSNPYGVLVQPGKTYVTDAGANTLNVISANGSNRILAYFPNNAIADATPTCVAKGPDGALYIGTLALVDSIVFGHAATVYRVDPAEADPDDFAKVLSVAKPWATGLWPINGCAFGPDGTFYASQLITNSGFGGGDVVKIPFSNPASHTMLANDSLAFPAGVAIGQDGAVYVANGSAYVPNGQVVRLKNR